MSTPKTTRIFNSSAQGGTNDSVFHDEHATSTSPATGVNTGISTRPKPSFSSQKFRAHRPSRVGNWRHLADDELPLSPSGGGGDKPPIPSALPQHSEPYVSPLPLLPMVVLSIVSNCKALCLYVLMPRRLCWESSCQQTFRLRSCYLW